VSEPARRRSLASLVHDEAPLGARRAAAVLVPVARELARPRAPGDAPDTDVSSSRVVLGEDGSVRIDGTGAPDGVSAGAGIGRLLFELLVGRPPLSADDAAEPHLQASLAPSTVALLLRSCTDAPGQWPSVEDWQHELARIAGPMSPPPPPDQVAAHRRRARWIAVALATLVLISVAVLVLAPRWWDAATEEGAPGAAAPSDAQPFERS
jgi:hypothetical protein